MTDHDVHHAAIAAGDADSFGLWASAVETRLRLSLSRYAARVDVEAVVQETLLVVWQVAPKVTPDGRANSLLRFAIRSARNRAISQLRRQGREVPHEQASEDGATYGETSDPLLRQRIADCHDKLPEKPALALRARLSGEVPRPDKDLARELQMTLNTFLQNVGRARRLLVACLEGQGIRFSGSEVKP